MIEKYFSLIDTELLCCDS